MFEVLAILCIFILLSIAVCIVLFQKVLRAEHVSRLNTSRIKSDVESSVLIFGATAWEEGPSPELEARLKTALEIAKVTGPSNYYLYGGIDEVNEAEAMREYLHNAGISDERILADCLGDNTRSSIDRFTETHMNIPAQQIIAISSGYHAWRIQTEGRKHKLNFLVISPEHSPEVDNSKVHFVRLLSEVMAILWYSIPRKITENINTGSTTFRHQIPNFFIDKILK